MVVPGIGGCGQLRLALAATVRRSIPGRYAFAVPRLRRRRRRCSVPVQAAAATTWRTWLFQLS